MIKGDSALTQEVKSKLKQGTKVSFIWHGSSLEHIGRIEVSKGGILYFVNEHNYEGDEISTQNEGMRYYNSLDSYFHFNEFNIIDQ